HAQGGDGPRRRQALQGHGDGSHPPPPCLSPPPAGEEAFEAYPAPGPRRRRGQGRRAPGEEAPGYLRRREPPPHGWRPGSSKDEQEGNTDGQGQTSRPRQEAPP